MCYSESYQGNPWRIALTNEMQRLADEFIAAGKLSEFKMSDANGDVPTQITQIQSFIDEGCDIIVTVAGSSTGLDEVIGKAAEAGIPVITNSGAVTAPSAINVDSNWYRWGYDMMDAIGQELGGKGNVVVVEGIAGSPIVAMQADGRNAALAKYPDLKVVATVNGDWTPTTTKNVILQTLATNPAEVDAVWTSGSESRLVAEAFAESGREPAARDRLDLRRRHRLLEGEPGPLPVHGQRRPPRAHGEQRVPHRHAHARGPGPQAQHPARRPAQGHHGRPARLGGRVHDARLRHGLPRRADATPTPKTC